MIPLPTIVGKPPGFNSNPGCVDCDLQAHGPTTVCMPTIPYSMNPKNKWAVLVLGEAPGANEDMAGVPFIGPAGQKLHEDYLVRSGLPSIADIYLGNSVRCRPPQNKTPIKTHLIACRKYWRDDLLKLSAKYKGKVAILCVGSTATQSVLGKKLTSTFTMQGTRITPEGVPGEFPVFSTFHPAFLLPGRSPSTQTAVDQHLKLLTDFIKNGKPIDDFDQISRTTAEEPDLGVFPAVLSLDIETYGAVAKYPEQRFFHPASSELNDGVPRSHLIQTVHLAWHDKRTSEDRTTSFLWASKKHRECLFRWLSLASKYSTTLIGMNLLFDLHYLRYCDPLLANGPLRYPTEIPPRFVSNPGGYGMLRKPRTPSPALRTSTGNSSPRPISSVGRTQPLPDPGGRRPSPPGRPFTDGSCGTPSNRLRLLDIAILSYLDYEIRPERGLKSLSALYSVTSYDRERSLKAGNRYPSALSPDLHSYGCRDAWATLKLYRILIDQLTKRPGTARMGAYSSQWYSDLLWTVLELSAPGVPVHTPTLRGLSQSTHWTCDSIQAAAAGPLSGPGSASYAQTLAEGANDILEAHNLTPEDLQYTEKKRKLSTSQHNTKILLNGLNQIASTALDLRDLQAEAPLVERTLFDTGHIEASIRELLRLDDHRACSKLLTSQIDPLLDRFATPPDARGISVLYPSYYVVPLAHESASSVDAGGTNQGRITCKRPALQTLARPVRACYYPRDPSHVFLYSDLSQIELRAAALLSGDPLMLHEYESDIDRHTKTADLVFDLLYGNGWTEKTRQGMSKKEWKESPYRMVGKTLNFLIIYLGGAIKFQSVVASETGITLPTPVCKQAIADITRRYQGLHSWQKGLLNRAKMDGFIELPLTGQSRTFLGGSKGIDETYVSTVVNFPVQCTAANIMLSAQTAIQRDLRRLRTGARVILQTYDSLLVECPRMSIPQTKSIMNKWLTNPPYFTDLCARLGRTIPLKADFETIDPWKENLQWKRTG